MERQRGNRGLGMKLKDVIFFVVAVVAVAVALQCLTFTGYGEVRWNQWLLVTANVIFFTLFMLTLQYRRKLTKLSNSVYVAFIIALYAEMFGFPLTMYILMGVFKIPDVYNLEFLLTQVMGEQQFYIIFHYYIFPASQIIMGIGMLLVIYGWKDIYSGKGKLVTTGIYRYTRHPQYLGFLLITLGLNVWWLTFITLALWPVIIIVYYKLAKTEEKEAAEEYGEEYLEYERRVPGWIPRLRRS
jgi:protein-S-isoprenylcysteine O-methyltransferase Ste14